MPPILYQIIIAVLIVNYKQQWSLCEELSNSPPFGSRRLKSLDGQSLTKNIIHYEVSDSLGGKAHKTNHSNTPTLQNEALKKIQIKLKTNLNNVLKAKEREIQNDTLQNYIRNISQTDYLGLRNLKISNLKILQDHYYSNNRRNKTTEKSELQKNDKKKHLDYVNYSYFKQLRNSVLQGGKEASDVMMQIIDPEAEKEDEVNDFEIFLSILKSIAYYQIHEITDMLYKGGRRRVKRDEESICYKGLGCFRDEGPFDYFDHLPSPPDEINTKFLLYTMDNQDKEKIFTYDNTSAILSSGFSVNLPTKIIIHGFGSSCHRVWVREMRIIFFAVEDVNIICVDWENGASVPNYVRAASNTRLVGRQVAVFLEELNSLLNTTLDEYHLIGFSLGAHVAGHAGAMLKNLARITGLDPAGPLFESFPPSVRLDPTDAKFVDVIHTNADSLLWGGLGAYEPMGDVDFYPNGGRDQNGCANLFVGGMSDILWPTNGDGRYLCNHRRGYKYFVESVHPMCKFPAFVCQDYQTFLEGDCFPCDNCGSMGYYADKAPGRGQLYLTTRETEPFCANQYKVMVFHSRGSLSSLPVSNYGKLEVTFLAPDGVNETLQLTKNEDTEMHAGGRTLGILVPHPAFSSISKIQLKYTAYKGWISSGSNKWAINKISIMDSFGVVQSYCYQGTTLVSDQAMTFPLSEGDCNPLETEHQQAWEEPNSSAEETTNSPSSNSTAVNSGIISTHNSSSNVGPVISPTTVGTITNESSTFSVIYASPAPAINNSNVSLVNKTINLGIKQNITAVSSKSKDTETPPLNVHTELVPPKPDFTQEKWVLWRDAPPPNLDNPDILPNNVDNKYSFVNENPVSIIPAPNLSTSPMLDVSQTADQNSPDSKPTEDYIDLTFSPENDKQYKNNTQKLENKVKWNEYTNVADIPDSGRLPTQINKSNLLHDNVNSYAKITINGKINGQSNIQGNYQPEFIRPPGFRFKVNQSPHLRNNYYLHRGNNEPIINHPHAPLRPPPPPPVYRPQHKINIEELSDDSQSVIRPIFYNSLMDGEFNPKDRSRALVFPSPANELHNQNKWFENIPSKPVDTIVGIGLAPRPPRPVQGNRGKHFGNPFFKSNNNQHDLKTLILEPPPIYKQDTQTHQRQFPQFSTDRSKYPHIMIKNVNTNLQQNSQTHARPIDSTTLNESPKEVLPSHEGRFINYDIPLISKFINSNINNKYNVQNNNGKTTASNVPVRHRLNSTHYWELNQNRKHPQNTNLQINNQNNKDLELKTDVKLVNEGINNAPPEYLDKSTVSENIYDEDGRLLATFKHVVSQEKLEEPEVVIYNEPQLNFNSKDQTQANQNIYKLSFLQSPTSVSETKIPNSGHYSQNTNIPTINYTESTPTRLDGRTLHNGGTLQFTYSSEAGRNPINTESLLNTPLLSWRHPLKTQSKTYYKNTPEVSSSKVSDKKNITTESNPYYLQILPSNFKLLPQLETYSLPKQLVAPPMLPRESVQNPPIKKSSRVGHARSMGGGQHLPVPGGRGAIFTPLQFRSRQNHNPRYIPLRSRVIYS